MWKFVQPITSIISSCLDHFRHIAILGYTEELSQNVTPPYLTSIPKKTQSQYMLDCYLRVWADAFFLFGYGFHLILFFSPPHPQTPPVTPSCARDGFIRNHLINPCLTISPLPFVPVRDDWGHLPPGSLSPLPSAPSTAPSALHPALTPPRPLSVPNWPALYDCGGAEKVDNPLDR